MNSLNQSTLSVVMVSYHTGDILATAIERLRADPALDELILVNNGNPPDMQAALRQWAEADQRLHLITGHGNVGFARGCNLGAKAARGDLLLFLNPDCLPAAGTLGQAKQQMMRLSAGAMIGAALQNKDGSPQRGSRRALLTPISALVELLPFKAWLPSALVSKRLNQHEQPLPQDLQPIAAISGAFMLLRAADYWRFGGMDEGYFLHVEDLDFCYRLQKSGGSIYFSPQLLVSHQLSSSKAAPIRVEWHKLRGFWRYFLRHFPTHPLTYPLLLATLPATALRLLLRGLVGSTTNSF